jgi:hypothetical protein
MRLEGVVQGFLCAYVMPFAMTIERTIRQAWVLILLKNPRLNIESPLRPPLTEC